MIWNDTVLENDHIFRRVSPVVSWVYSSESCEVAFLNETFTWRAIRKNCVCTADDH